jgi:hypothetical protein
MNNNGGVSMLIGMLIGLLFGGGAQNLAVSQEDYKATKAEIMEVMQDIEQRQEVIQVLYGLKRDSKKYSKRYLKHMRPFIKELKQYDSLDVRIRDELAEIDRVRLDWHEAVIAARFEIRDLMTREEWESVFGVQ